MKASVSDKKGGLFSSVLVTLAFWSCLSTCCGLCRADRGGWHVSSEPVRLKESGQRAIIGWDGQIQVLCLGTDVSSSHQTTVIEFLPLPAEPKATLGSRESFEAVQEVLARHRIRFYKEKISSGKGLGRDAQEGEAFTITFHERLGAHDVTVVKVNRADEFVDWIQQKANEVAGTQAAVPEAIRKLVTKYLDEYRCSWFVFDVIEVGPDPQSVEPIIYEFMSPRLFYPLEISTTFHGRTTIDLIAFSENPVDPDPFLNLDFQVSSTGRANAADLQQVLPRLKELLGESALLQAFRYDGDMSALRGNIAAGLRRDNLAYTPGQYERGRRMAFYSGAAAATFFGVVITLVSLWPMYFAAKRQQPRWGLRLVVGFLLGMPLGLALVAVCLNVLRLLKVGEYPPYIYTYSAEPVRLLACSMGMGFILFCFQLGLRRRWYRWALIYAALALPATFLVVPESLEGTFSASHWVRLWLDARHIFLALLIVFVLLFLGARLVVWTASRFGKSRSASSQPDAG